MPVPSSISDLSTTPALNSPPGSESPSSIDDYLRTLSAFIKQINDLAATKADASALASKADDSAVVKLTGAQTVAGTKTFSASPVAPNPTAGTRSQALATMQMFADEFIASLAASGYQKLPSGLIIQWGSAVTNSSGVVTVTLPIEFPNSVRNVQVSANNSIASNAIINTGARTLSTIVFYGTNGASGYPGVAGVVGFDWFAIGH